MKVKDLKAKLNEFDDEQEVYIEDFIEGCNIKKLEYVISEDKDVILTCIDESLHI